MAPPKTSRPTAVLVVRLWMDGDRPGALRGRITSTDDVSQRTEATTAVSTPDEVRAAVAEWLGTFLTRHDETRAPGAPFTQR